MISKKEILCLYDANKNYLNKQIYRHNIADQIIGKEYHLVTNVFCIEKTTKKILITKRHTDKEYGNTWECTAGKCIAFENTLDAGIRELYEETSLSSNKNELKLINTFIFDKYIVDTYVCALSFNINDVVLQDNETIDKMLIDYYQLVEMINKNMFSYSIQRRIGFYLKNIKNFIDHLGE